MADSIFCAQPLPQSWVQNELGYWSDEGRSKLSLIETGVYAFAGKEYTRGYEKEAFKDGVESIVKKFEEGVTHLTFKVRRFIGMGLALMGGDWANKWRTFVTMERELNSPKVTGTSKRMPQLFETLEAGWHSSKPYALEQAPLSHPYRKGKFALTNRIGAEDAAAAECQE
jgi:hypothetical protein